MAASAYYFILKKEENLIFRSNHIFRHRSIYRQPIFTKQWNYNIVIQILYSYLIYTDRILDVFFLLLAKKLSQFHEKPIRKDCVTEKSTLKNLCDGHHYFGCMSSFLCLFFRLFRFYEEKKSLQNMVKGSYRGTKQIIMTVRLFVIQE